MLRVFRIWCHALIPVLRAAPALVLAAAFATAAFSSAEAMAPEATEEAARNAALAAYTTPPLWTYTDEKYEFSTPQLSPDNNHLVFVRQRYLPGGHAAESYTDAQLDKLWAPLKNDARYADPEVMVMDLTGGAPRRIDYGWDPVFSADGQKILYAHQTLPLAGGRPLAATLRGNEIREHDLASGGTVTLAKPAFGHLDAPRYDHTGKVLFFLSDKVNGDFAHHVGVGTPDGKGGVTELFPPRKSHGLYHIIHDMVSHKGTLLVRLARPLTVKKYHLAERYAHELLRGVDGMAVYTWGEADIGEPLPMGLRQCPAGAQVYQEGWRDLGTLPASAPSAVTDPAPADPAREGWAISFFSPDCTLSGRMLHDFTSVERAANSLAFHPADKGPPRRWRTGESMIADPAWSPDSTRLVLVTRTGDFYEPLERSGLVVLRVDDLRRSEPASAVVP